MPGDAFKIVETEPLDLVILDMHMPAVDSLEALPRILGLKEGLPVMLNTAYTLYQDSFMSWATEHLCGQVFRSHRAQKRRSKTQ